jgi:hypothetical protein
MSERELNAFEAQAEQYEQFSVYEKVKTGGPATVQEISGYKTLKWLSLSIGLLIAVYEIILLVVLDVIVIRQAYTKRQNKQVKNE